MLCAFAIALAGCSSSLRVHGDVDREFDRLAERFTYERSTYRVFSANADIEDRYQGIYWDPPTLDRERHAITFSGGRWFRRERDEIALREVAKGDTEVVVTTEVKGFLFTTDDTFAAAYLTAYLDEFVYGGTGRERLAYSLSGDERRFIDSHRARWRALRSIADGRPMSERRPGPDAPPWLRARSP